MYMGIVVNNCCCKSFNINSDDNYQMFVKQHFLLIHLKFKISVCVFKVFSFIKVFFFKHKFLGFFVLFFFFRVMTNMLFSKKATVVSCSSVWVKRSAQWRKNRIKDNLTVCLQINSYLAHSYSHAVHTPLCTLTHPFSEFSQCEQQL